MGRKDQAGAIEAAGRGNGGDVTHLTKDADHRRWRFLVDIFQAFLDVADEGQFVALADEDASDQYIQFKRNHGILYGEVGSREWDVTSKRRPLGLTARERLGAEGFTHGGPERNYICDNLAQSAPYLADLYQRLHETAYETRPPAFPTIVSDVGSVSIVAGDRVHIPTRVPGHLSDSDRRRVLRNSSIRATAGLRLRVERALQSNFAAIGTNTADLEAVRRAVEAAGSWDALPDWVHGWIKKAEEGPLWVSIDPRLRR